MKQSITRSLMLIGLAAINSLANAQQRQIDLEIQIEEPANAAVLQSGETFSLVLSVTNHGPDEVLEGDTLFIVLPTRQLTSGVMGSAIAVGENYVLATEYELTAPVTETSVDLELCAQLADDPSTQISDNTGNPMLVSYIDPDPSNNLVCYTVTIEAQPSSVADLHGQTQTLDPYPNPANNHVHVPVDPSLPDPIMIRIRDIAGKTVLNKRFGKTDHAIVDVSVEQLQEGIYILESRQGERHGAGKFIIHR